MRVDSDFLICNLRLKGKMASVLFSRKSAIANRKSFPIQPGATPAAKKPLTAWGLTMKTRL
jgi:hypothetical protein